MIFVNRTLRANTRRSLTCGNVAGCFFGDGALPAVVRDGGDTALGGAAGERVAVRTTAPTTRSKTTRVSGPPRLFGGLDAGDAARAGTHRTCTVDPTVRGRNSGDG